MILSFILDSIVGIPLGYAIEACWGTVVAEKGASKMIIAASKFQNTDIVMMGVILIGIIGYGIGILMRKAEDFLVPWK